MEKMRKKKKLRRFFGLTLGEICALATLVGSVIIFTVRGVHYFDEKFDHIDRKFEAIDRRFDGVDKRLDRIEIDLKKTSDLLNVYLSWRFLYVNDPARNDLKPLYNPNVRTLEFIDRDGRIVK